jgi:16S rRNA (cytosine967-C5)-methyltransferase
MRQGARLQAAIEILDDILAKGRPAALALADWGRSHRFAGSGDRASIGNLVYDCLRKRHSLAWRMGEDTPRALALAAMRWEWGEGADAVSVMCTGGGHDPSPLTADETHALQAGRALDDAPAFIQGDYPEWLHSAFTEVFADDAAAAGAALAERAPIDLRVNTLKATRDKVLRAFADEGAAPTPFSPVGVRIPPRARDGRSPKVEASTAHGKGWFEVQDEGSQLAALLAGVGPRMQVADVCAGGGGKTLAFAALMQNTGQIFAYDADAMRFRPLFERLKRAGARNVQALEPGKPQALVALSGRMDVVLIDAPCSGTGVWRRKPDSKWRLTPDQIEARIATQRDILAMAAPLVKPGGRLVYVTCSVLHSENGAQVSAFLGAHPEFADQAVDASAFPGAVTFPQSASRIGLGIQLSPHIHATDGFYIALMQRKAGPIRK